MPVLPVRLRPILARSGLLLGFAVSAAQAASSAAIYDFSATNPAHGYGPVSGLTLLNNTLYGTTQAGGASNEGVVYLVEPGNETVIHSFSGLGGDGADPESSLLAIGGTLYGATWWGGASGLGAVFSLKPEGTGAKYKTIYSFGSRGGIDFANPSGPLLYESGAFYGTAQSGGGASYDGGVYSVTLAGVEKLLYLFQGGSDGKFPGGGLVDLKGTFYGETSEGGGTGCNGTGCGTIFSLTPAGAETVIYAFQGGVDGVGPAGGLLKSGGILYGVTGGGGANGYGTVFSITPAGVKTVLHSFSGVTDGTSPSAGLIEVAGNFFGVTSGGGGHGNCSETPPAGCGTVFEITRGGSLTVLAQLDGKADGGSPLGRLTSVDGYLWGTSWIKGGRGSGGAVFVVPLPAS
jgi:uncharacterized repeat protein (TIGR03803 family)